MTILKQFGGRTRPELIDRYQRSDHWRDGRFHNLEPTSLSISLRAIPGLIYEQIARRSLREPNEPLPVADLDRNAFSRPAADPIFGWYGHSALLLRIQQTNLLIDPMLGPDASPIAPVTTRRFSRDTLRLTADLPEIDLVLLTHDHYDHLDYASIQKLKAKTAHYFVALGVKRHLVAWGVDPERITEFDWWDQRVFRDITVTFTPTRHFSGRGLTDRLKSLWGGWAFQTRDANIWFSGDGGYGQHFRQIGERLGPFDFGFMECGQYNEHWPQLHLFPEESVEAAIDARVGKAIPVHWAGFSLSTHSWMEPAERFVAAAAQKKLQISLPYLGKLHSIAETQTDPWWTER